MKRTKKPLSLLLSIILPLLLCMPVRAASSYTDVPENAWYAGAAEGLLELGVMNGTGGGRFSPDAVFSRAQLAAVLYRLAGEPAVSGEDSFTDTEPGRWYSDAVLWASANGIVNGYGSGRFGTNDPTTQEQLAVMLWRDAGSPSMPGNEETGADAWAADAVRWLKAEGLSNERGPTFAPKEPASRAQVADVVFRYLRLKEAHEASEKELLRLSSLSASGVIEPDAAKPDIREVRLPWENLSEIPIRRFEEDPALQVFTDYIEAEFHLRIDGRWTVASQFQDEEMTSGTLQFRYWIGPIKTNRSIVFALNGGEADMVYSSWLDQKTDEDRLIQRVRLFENRYMQERPLLTGGKMLLSESSRYTFSYNTGQLLYVYRVTFIDAEGTVSSDFGTACRIGEDGTAILR